MHSSIRVYFRQDNKLGRVDVSNVEDHKTAIAEVETLLWEGAANYDVWRRLLAVVK